MKRLPDFAVGFVLGFAVLLIIFLLSSDFAAHYEICEPAHSGAKECASHNVISFALFKIGAALDALNGAITAIATAFIAWFTLSLRQSTDRLWDAGEKQRLATDVIAIRQSGEMQASIAAAQQSAGAAIQALGADRAWIVFDNIPINQAAGGKIMGKDFDLAVFAQPVWRNRGRSPALQATIYATGILGGFADEPPTFQAIWPDPFVSMIAGPDQTIIGVQCPMVDDDMLAIFERRSAWFVYSSVRYRDMFNPEIDRFSEVCIRIRYNGEFTAPNGVKGVNWEVAPIGLQNTAS
jgi:hypothetical protein